MLWSRIKAGPACQKTALQYSQRRYLSSEAPACCARYPPTCSPKGCTCRYLHHDDRRSGEDRRIRDAWNAHAQQVTDGDRRRAGGRRVTDH